MGQKQCVKIGFMLGLGGVIYMDRPAAGVGAPSLCGSGKVAFPIGSFLRKPYFQFSFPCAALDGWISLFCGVGEVALTLHIVKYFPILKCHIEY